MSFLEDFFDDHFDVPAGSGNSAGDSAGRPPARSNPADSGLPEANSFEQASKSDMAQHLKVDKYDSFQLTGAVRPALDLKIKPTEGYRHEHYVDDETGASIPVVMAAASREKLFPLFISLIEKLGPVVDVVLESSHEADAGGHRDFYRDNIDMAVLISVLYDYEDLLLNDGCTGIAVLNPGKPQEVQFEEHKLLIVYGSPLEQYEFTMEKVGVSENESMRFITEAEHVHSSSENYLRSFEELRCALGLDGSHAEQAKDEYPDDFYNDGENWDQGGDLSGGLA